MREGGLYRSFLRVSMLVVTSALIFDGGYISPITKDLSSNTIQYVASVGTSVVASVEPNEINTLSAELRKRQEELDRREALLNSQEIAARDFGTSNSPDYSTYVLSAILFILTVLIVLNYVMDYTRVRMQKQHGQTMA